MNNGDQGVDPPVEETLRNSHSPNDSNTTPTDPALGENRNKLDKFEKSKKKKKVDK